MDYIYSLRVKCALSRVDLTLRQLLFIGALRIDLRPHVRVYVEFAMIFPAGVKVRIMLSE